MIKDLISFILGFLKFGPTLPAKGDAQKRDEASPGPQKETYIPDSVKRMIYGLTSAFEGDDLGRIKFENLTGNFDDMGFSIGFMQWCTGQGSDLPLFLQMLKDHDNVVRRIFGNKYDEFLRFVKMAPKERLAWAIAINDSHKNIKEPWKTLFTEFCKTAEFQSIQLEFAERSLDEAVVYCNKFKVKSIRALALMFDIVTQNGSIRQDTTDRIWAAKKEKEQSGILTERQFLAIIATERANAAKARWVNDVKTRKMCIVNGKGIVHGMSLNLDKLGITDCPFLIDKA